MCFYNSGETESSPLRCEKGKQATTYQVSARREEGRLAKVRTPTGPTAAWAAASRRQSPRHIVHEHHEGKARATAWQSGDTPEEGWIWWHRKYFLRCPENRLRCVQHYKH